MSEIAFVNELGDALERAAVKQRAAGRNLRRRQRGVVAIALGLAVATGGAAAAGVFSAPERTTDGITCYSELPATQDNAVVVPATFGSAIASCSEALAQRGVPASALLECDHEGGIAVIPGREGATCERAGFAALSPARKAERRHLQELQAGLSGLQRSSECVPPAELVRRVDGWLSDGAWQSWRARLQSSDSPGPCGTAAIDAQAHEVVVSGGFDPSAASLLFGAGGLVAKLDERADASCSSASDLEALADSELTRAGLGLQSATSPKPDGLTIGDRQAARYEAGCAVVAGVTPAADRGVVVLHIWERP